VQVSGFSHVTIAVSDLGKSLDFYVGILGLKLVHKGNIDVYLEWGQAWICLFEQRQREIQDKPLGVDHIAFYIVQEHFGTAVQVLKDNSVEIVRGPIQRGTGWSVNFLDPDGTELELHTSTLQDRMKVWK